MQPCFLFSPGSASHVNEPSALLPPHYLLRAFCAASGPPSQVGLCLANRRRLSLVWPAVAAHLALVAAQARAPPLRAFAVDSFRAVARSADISGQG